MQIFKSLISVQKPFLARYACLPRRFVPRPVRRLPVRARTQTGANLSAAAEFDIFDLHQNQSFLLDSEF
ncbi:MAG: hypothetical protein AB1742_11150 [bacterium]